MKLKTLSIIYAGYGPSWEQALYARRLGGTPWLAWVARRLTECQHVERVVLQAHRAVFDEVQQLLPGDIPVLCDGAGNPLQTTIELARTQRAQAVVCVQPDNPLLDPVLVDRLVCSAESHHGCDYASYVTATGEPASWTHLGMSVEWCLVEALEEIARKPGQSRNDFTRALFGRPDRFTLRLLPLPDGFEESSPCKGDCAAQRYEAQWQLADTLQRQLNNPELSWQKIARTFQGTLAGQTVSHL